MHLTRRAPFGFSRTVVERQKTVANGWYYRCNCNGYPYANIFHTTNISGLKDQQRWTTTTRMCCCRGIATTEKNNGYPCTNIFRATTVSLNRAGPDQRRFSTTPAQVVNETTSTVVSCNKIERIASVRVAIRGSTTCRGSFVTPVMIARALCPDHPTSTPFGDAIGKVIILVVLLDPPISFPPTATD